MEYICVFASTVDVFFFYENEHNYAHGDETTDRLRTGNCKGSHGSIHFLWDVCMDV